MYTPKNAPESVHGFGVELRGQEKAGRKLAEYEDTKYALIKTGMTQVKEKFRQPVCLNGVGCGKSALLSHSLGLLRKYCQNKELLELLKDENHPLAIHISFNSMTSFHSAVESKNVELAVIRRILASCLNIKWEEALSIPLSDSLTLVNCINAIVAYHKKVNGMNDDQKLFFYLGIDEINKLIPYSDGASKPDYSMLKKLTRAVQILDLRSCFVSTLRKVCGPLSSL